MNKKILVICAALLLSGCSNTSNSPSISTSVDSANPFENDDKINVEYLKEQGCLFFESLAFGKDDQNHVFVIESNEVKEHHRYDAVEFKKENFDNLVNLSIVDAIEYIGIPSFVDFSTDLTLDYLCDDEVIRRLITNKIDNELVIIETDTFCLDKDDYENWIEPAKAILPTYEICEKIKIAMSIDEIVARVGKPQRDIASGIFLYEFDINDGKILTVWLNAPNTAEVNAIRPYATTETFGTYSLYATRVQILSESLH